MIDDDTWIEAPIDAVFEYLASPGNLVDVTPSLVDICAVAGLPTGGYGGEFTFEMLGASLHGHFRDVEFERPDRRVDRLDGAIAGTTTSDLRSEDGRTRVDVRTESVPPDPEFAGRLTDPLVARYLTREVESTLQNVKTTVEET